MSIQPIERLEEEIIRLKEENQRLKDQWNILNETCKRWEKMFAEREGKNDGK